MAPSDTTHPTTSTTVSGVTAVLDVRPPAAPEDPVQAWMVDALSSVVAGIRRAVETHPQIERLVVVLHGPDAETTDRRAAVAGLVEGVRGIAQALTLELAPARRVNAVLADAAGSGVRDALALLTGPRGGFVAGASIDLREHA